MRIENKDSGAKARIIGLRSIELDSVVNDVLTFLKRYDISDDEAHVVLNRAIRRLLFQAEEWTAKP